MKRAGQDPPVSFSAWTHWSERNGVKNAHLPGVYMLAQWEEGPPGQVDPISQQIVYIGEMSDNSLMGRWQQFNRAAFEGKPGHTGGVAYRDAFGDEGETLFVAAFVPEGLSRELRGLYIKYVERKLLWEWARTHDGPPACNIR